jgi:O-antigen/teichoic acid export membrane protein
MVNKRFFNDALWAVCGQLGSAIALLAGTRILTELVSPEIYGPVALFNGFGALGVTLFAYPFICAGMRLLPECLNKRERSDLYRVVSGLTARSTGLAIAILAVAGGIYAYAAESDEAGLFAVSGFLLAATVRRELGVQLLIGERRQREASLWQTSDSLLRPLLAILLVWLVGAQAVWVLLGYALASVAANTAWSLFHRRQAEQSLRHRPTYALSIKHDVWAYALPLIPMELLLWVSGLGDRYVIGYLMTATQVGLYAATYTLINEAFNRSAMVLLRSFQPVYFRHCSMKQMKQGFNILMIWIISVIAMGIIGVLALVATKDWVASILLSKAYHSAVALMPAIAIGCALQALGTVLAQPLLAAKRTRALLIGRACGALAAVVSIPIMLKLYGLQGAAIANPIYFCVEALAMALLAKPWQLTGVEATDAPCLSAEEATAG